jgi:L-threonylcarbamoyladenylate synthase
VPAAPTKFEHANPMPIDPTLIEQAAQHLLRGGVVAFPTETVYGLGADAGNGQAVASIYATKRRPPINPLICHVPDLPAARALADFSPLADRLAAAYWPGPLTLVLPLRPEAGIHPLVTAGLNTIALRCPAHPDAQALLRAVGRPIAAPSANPSGQLSSTRFSHVQRAFSDQPNIVILPDSQSPLGLESTIVDGCGDTPLLLREGAITREELQDLLGTTLLGASAQPQATGGTTIKAPGMMRRHYAPRKPLRLNATTVTPDQALLAFGANPIAGAAHSLNLSETGNLLEAAANFYAMLHQLDNAAVASIAVMPLPNHGLGRALNDRLARAIAED